MPLANLNLGNEGPRIVASITEQSVNFGNLVSVDISERKRAQAALQQARKIYRESVTRFTHAALHPL